jgi:hypothetical protein
MPVWNDQERAPSLPARSRFSLEDRQRPVPVLFPALGRHAMEQLADGAHLRGGGVFRSHRLTFGAGLSRRCRCGRFDRRKRSGRNKPPAQPGVRDSANANASGKATVSPAGGAFAGALATVLPFPAQGVAIPAARWYSCRTGEVRVTGRRSGDLRQTAWKWIILTRLDRPKPETDLRDPLNVRREL